ncbi:MAG: GNAT family N-acetyltransferase [Paracoccaceae bacterium]
MQIRPLEINVDLEKVTEFYRASPDYWQTAEGSPPGPDKARAFFFDGPPGCNVDESHRLGLFIDDRLSGLAELSFGFPNPGDAYLGFMILGPWARNAGIGKVLLAHIERLARQSGADKLYLAVMTINARGRAFWEREGFSATGKKGVSVGGENQQELHRLVKQL